MNKIAQQRVLVFTLAVGGTLLAGCDRPAIIPAKHADADSAGIHLYEGLDRSDSYRPHLSGAVSLCAGQAGLLDPGTDALTLYSLDRQAREVSDGPASDDPDAVQHTLVTQVKNVPSQGGTFPAKFWTAVAERAAADPKTVVIGLYSDADNDDETAASGTAICIAAQKLADNPHVATVSVYGVDPDNRAALRHLFAPLGDRLHLYGATEMTADAAAQAVDTARAAATAHS